MKRRLAWPVLALAGVLVFTMGAARAANGPTVGFTTPEGSVLLSASGIPGLDVVAGPVEETIGFCIPNTPIDAGPVHAQVGVCLPVDDVRVEVDAVSASARAYLDGRTIEGVATFDAGSEGGVIVELTQDTTGVNPNTGEVVTERKVAWTGNPEITCDGSNSCTWKIDVPFILAPGTYYAVATASEVDPDDPDCGTDPPLEDCTILKASAEIAVTIL